MPKQKKTTAKKSKKKSIPKPKVRPITQDVLIVCVTLSAIFVFLAHFFPEKTGFFGDIVALYLGNFLGRGVGYVPFFMLAFGISLVFRGLSWKRYLVSLASSFLMLLVLLETLSLSSKYVLLWPLAEVNDGGWLGAVLLFSVRHIFGEYGTWVAVFGTFILSAIILFNISIRSFLSLLKIELNEKKTQNKQVKSNSGTSFLRKLMYFLFFSKKTEIMPLPTKSTAAIVKPKAPPLPEKNEAKPEFSLPEDLIKEEALPETPKKKVTSEKVPLQQPLPTSSSYKFPPISLLEKAGGGLSKTKDFHEKSQENALRLEQSLQSFNVDAKVVNITPGPTVTRYELKPGDGVKISKITALSKDIALKLAATNVRIEAPIPGKALIGIEVPNSDVATVTVRNIINDTDFYENSDKLLIALGLTITGEAILMKLSKLPHILIAGATGSGKSVCINAIILSILLRATPEEVKFLMIDPKKVELSLYNGIPHLLAPVVTNPHKAAAMLKKWALAEMERRYEEFSKAGVKDIEGYNARVEEINRENQSATAAQDNAEETSKLFAPDKLPYIVVIIDELADLMMVASHEVENAICRLAQMARATGIHLVIATQRPSVNVVTGLIKANVPSRISFFLQSQIDSRTILDMPGAEKLLGRGDMLYSPVGTFKPKRVQGVFVSEKEVKNVVGFLKKQGQPEYLDEIMDLEPLEDSASKSDRNASEKDALYDDAKALIISTKYASTSYLQRKLRIGYNRAARIMDELEADGVISEYVGERKSRTVS